MSRTIKFRVWLGDHWVDWLPSIKTHGEYDEVFIDRDQYETHGGKLYIEQFTGLKDKNGKEIYEGDIIAADCGEGYARVAEVYYDEGIPGFDARCLRGGIDNYFSFIEEYEVVGNIHEDEWKERYG